VSCFARNVVLASAPQKRGCIHDPADDSERQQARPRRRSRNHAHRRCRHPRADHGVPERRPRQRDGPHPTRRQRRAGGDQDRRGAGRPEDGRGLEAPRLQRAGGAGAGRPGAPDRHRPRGPPRRPREALEGQRRRSDARPDLRAGADEVLALREGRRSAREDRRARRRRRRLARARRHAAQSGEARQGRRDAQGGAEHPHQLGLPEPASREALQGEEGRSERARVGRARHPGRSELGRRLGVLRVDAPRSWPTRR